MKSSDTGRSMCITVCVCATNVQKTVHMSHQRTTISQVHIWCVYITTKPELKSE